MRYLKCLPILSALTFTLACDGPSLSPDAAYLRVEVVTDRASMRTRDTLGVTVTVTNPTPYVFSTEEVVDGVTFEVLNEEGERVGPVSGGFAPDVPTRRLTLRPGESIERGFSWIPPGLLGAPAPPPGEYTVVGRVDLIGDTVVSDARPLALLPIVQLDAIASPTVLSVGETVELTVTLTNVDVQQARPPALTSCSFQAVVWRGDRPVDLLSGCPPGNPLLGLEPGESTRTILEWQATEPGGYQVVFQLEWHEQPGLEKILSIRVS